MVNRPCLDCGKPGPNTRCDKHRKLHANTRYAKRGSTTDRGYGSAYQLRRPQVLKGATHCRTCGEEFTEDNPATAGHIQDLRDLPREQRRVSAATADLMPQCARCNYGWVRGTGDTG